MKRIILAMAALFLHAVCFAADFRVISDTKVYDGDYHYISELKKGDIVQLFDCSATTDEKLDFAFTLLLNMNGKMRLVDLSTVIPNETSELFDERVRYTTLTTQGKNWIPVQNIDILRSRSRDRYYETYKNKLARYDEPDIFQISWHEHYKVRTAAQIENCFLYFTDEKNYAIFLYVKDIRTTGNGYMVSCEMFKSYTSDLFVEKNDFLENLNEKGQIVNLLLIFDGDYLHIYTEKKQRLFTYALMDSEYSTQMENLIRNETCDLSKVTWPRHADGTCDYEDEGGNATAATSGNANKEESANTPATDRAESVKESKPAPSVGKTAAVTENLRLRTDDDRTAEVVTTLAAGTRVKVEATGREETIDGIASNWVRVAVLGGVQDRDGNAVAAGTEGWLFSGYLSEAEDAESGSPGGEADAKKAAALPIVPIAVGVAVLAVLLAAILLAAKKSKSG